MTATRDRRAADRTVTAWARANAATLRQLAGQITALPDLSAAGARSPNSPPLSPTATRPPSSPR